MSQSSALWGCLLDTSCCCWVLGGCCCCSNCWCLSIVMASYGDADAAEDSAAGFWLRCAYPWYGAAAPRPVLLQLVRWREGFMVAESLEHLYRAAPVMSSPSVVILDPISWLGNIPPEVWPIMAGSEMGAVVLNICMIWADACLFLSLVEVGTSQKFRRSDSCFSSAETASSRLAMASSSGVMSFRNGLLALMRVVLEDTERSGIGAAQGKAGLVLAGAAYDDAGREAREELDPDLTWTAESWADRALTRARASGSKQELDRTWPAAARRSGLAAEGLWRSRESELVRGVRTRGSLRTSSRDANLSSEETTSLLTLTTQLSAADAGGLEEVDEKQVLLLPPQSPRLVLLATREASPETPGGQTLPDGGKNAASVLSWGGGGGGKGCLGSSWGGETFSAGDTEEAASGKPLPNSSEGGKLLTGLCCWGCSGVISVGDVWGGAACCWGSGAATSSLG